MKAGRHPVSPALLRKAVLSFAGVLSCGLLATGFAVGQSTQSPEWTTSSYSPSRDAWQRDETKITSRNAGKIQMLWKLKTDNKTMGMQSFREPLIVSGVKTAKGSETVAIFAGSSNDVYGIDADTGTLVWQKKLKWASSQPQEAGEGQGFICTNALSATPVISPPDAKERVLYVMTTDGYLRLMDPATGEEKEAPVQMLPNVYGKPYGLNLVNGVVYTITGQGCGGVPNVLYAYNTVTKKVTLSSPPQGGLWGTAGPAIGTDGTIYFESGDHPYDAKAGLLSTSFQAYTFSNDTLTLKDYFTPSNYEWLTKRDLDMNTTPVVFPYKGRDLLVGGGKEGRFYLLDSKSIGGADHQTPLFRSELIANANVNFQTEGTWGSFAAWKDEGGTQWVLAPNGGPTTVKFPINYGETPNGGIIAFKVEEKDGKTVLANAWQSRDMLTAEPPVVANGLVFVLAGGEFTGQTNEVEGGLYSAEDRIKRSVPAKLYVLDAKTGKELYSSGNEIASFLHQAGLSVAGGRILFGTFDGTVYCFGTK
ncbi:PQQ-binding-like beta-propeller repeat protein [Edaphobacter modestus]|uniref:Putative pyrroloquinoline-quinone binding quinoprotein n=1 Tax=Edaphobacter modestus TaxID=388466 RepID=A0A4Q7YUS8_9BACT|nr:PQQ-binding-like beta-propeller repeat protein [Edaphobacter modestus]RZU41074.1 putative pyrroloquinoline-quinone binding quinoprotein [Edaphobacter modestus]